MACAWYKEDDRRGGNHTQAAAAGDPGASPGRGPYKLEDMEKMDFYYLEMDYAKSSWKAWQKGLHDAAKKYDRRLFTKDQILALGTWLSNLRLQYRNHGDVTMPDWVFCKEYDIAPQISIGYGCTLTFKPVAGYYNGK